MYLSTVKLALCIHVTDVKDDIIKGGGWSEEYFVNCIKFDSIIFQNDFFKMLK